MPDRIPENQPDFQPGEDPELDALHGEGTQKRIHDEANARTEDYLEKRRQGEDVSSASGTAQKSQEELDAAGEKREQEVRDTTLSKATIATIVTVSGRLGRPLSDNDIKDLEAMDTDALVQKKEDLMAEWRNSRNS